MAPRLSPPRESVPPLTTSVHLHKGAELVRHLPRWEAYVTAAKEVPLSRHTAWLTVFAQGLGHTPYCLEAVAGSTTRGLLPLSYVHSLLFGRFLVSLPYLNYGGVLADDQSIACELVDRAVALADSLKVRFLELRQERPVGHPLLTQPQTDKVHMRLPLPGAIGELWDRLPSKVRNQVRK